MVNVLDDQELIYDGDDLGAVYNKLYTTFKVWAPTVDKVTVLVYEDFNDDLGQKHEMKKLRKRGLGA